MTQTELLEGLDKAEAKRKRKSEKAADKVKAGAKKAKRQTRARKLKYPEVTPDMVPAYHICVTTERQFHDMLEAMAWDISQGEPLTFDAETHTYFDAPLPKKDRVVGFNFWTQADGGRAWYVPFGHTTGEDQLDREYVLERLKPYFTNPAVRWIGHNLKYDYQVTVESCGFDIPNLYFDTLIASQLLNENDDASLEFLSHKYLKAEGDGKTGYKKLFGKTKFSEIPLTVATWYACKDAEYTFKLYKFQKAHLDSGKLGKVAKLFWETEMPLVRVVSRMELVGFPIDVEYLRDKVGGGIEQELETLDTKMRRAFRVDSEFNFNSPKQLSTLLFQTLRLPNPEKSSTNAKVLEKLKDKHEGVGFLLEHRKAKKVHGTYVEGLLNRVVEGKIYPSFNQMGAGTGRFSSSNPNWQNLPSKEDRIRKAIIPPRGYLITSIDYSQIELRILAALSRDPGMLQAYAEGYDIHSHTAALIFDRRYEDYREAEEADTPTAWHKKLQNERKLAKNANFGIIYGQTAYGFSRFHGVSEQEAQEVIDGWFRAYPMAHQWLKDIVDFAFDHGYVETMFGRKRRLHKYLYSGQENLMRYGARMAQNAPIQGTAADLLKIALVKVAPVAESVGAITVATIHDENMFFTPEDMPEESIILLKATMEQAADIGVPVVCDCEIQTRWGEKVRSL